jgi:hypothetical protein
MVRRGTSARPASAAEVAARLDRGLPGTATRPGRRALWLAILATLIAGAALAYVLLA